MWSNKIIRYSIISVVSIILLVYFFIVIACLDVYYPGTIINGKDYGFKSPSYVENEMYENPADFKFEIVFRDKTEVIVGNRIGYNIDYKSYLDEIKRNQNPFLWFTTFWDDGHKIDRCINIDYKKLSSELEQLPEFDKGKMIEPDNPDIVMNKEGVVEAVNKNLGTTIENTSALKDRIADIIKSGGNSINVEEEGFYKEPEYLLNSNRVVKCVEFCNRITSLHITYEYGDVEIPLTPDQLFSTIKIAPNYNYSISPDKVRALVESFSRLHDTYGKIRTFKTHSGRKINVSEGDYGWLIDYEKETEQLYNDIIHRTNVTRTPIFENEAYFYDEDGNDLGNFYAEVDLDNQHMYLIRNKQVVLESDVVTGCVSLHRGTPKGIYNIDYKQSPAILRGEDYESPVTFWMPFNGGVGFHDATWRGSFGGQIYIYGGSHGCVNMPYAKAQELYGVIEEGMPVIVY